MMLMFGSPVPSLQNCSLRQDSAGTRGSDIIEETMRLLGHLGLVVE